MSLYQTTIAITLHHEKPFDPEDVSCLIDTLEHADLTDVIPSGKMSQRLLAVNVQPPKMKAQSPAIKATLRNDSAYRLRLNVIRDYQLPFTYTLLHADTVETLREFADAAISQRICMTIESVGGKEVCYSVPKVQEKWID